MLCAMTGQQHRLFWMRSAWWCEDCRQKIESCCEGGGCPSVADVMGRAEERPATDRPARGAPPVIADQGSVPSQQVLARDGPRSP
jgi:hypothetical protein